MSEFEMLEKSFLTSLIGNKKGFCWYWTFQKTRLL